MRCFKIFFKHTWQPQQMENVGRFSSGRGESRTCDSRSANETELGELRAASQGTVRGVPCHNGACKTMKSRPEHSLNDSPWHYLKTVFLVSMLIAFVVWLVVYILLTQYEVL